MIKFLAGAVRTGTGFKIVVKPAVTGVRRKRPDESAPTTYPKRRRDDKHVAWTGQLVEPRLSPAETLEEGETRKAR